VVILRSGGECGSFCLCKPCSSAQSALRTAGRRSGTAIGILSRPSRLEEHRARMARARYLTGQFWRLFVWHLLKED